MDACEAIRPAQLPASGSILCGDCRAVMAGWPESCIDTIITDPPYELGFMGKSWDSTGVAFDPETWRACLRVAKPGALLLAFGGSRTFHRIACAIEDAGWELRDTLMWLYGSGFPKSLDISKAIDKAAGAEREVVGTARGAGMSAAQPPVGTFRDDAWQPQGPDLPITAPATEAAQLWHGWGTALKPAFEPIILAMKPLDGTFAQNAQRHGVAGLNIDGGRIGTSKDVPASESTRSGYMKGWAGGHSTNSGFDPNIGRWPANVILDRESAAALDAQSGEEPSRFFYTAKASSSERNAGCGLLEAKVKAAEYRQPTGNPMVDRIHGCGKPALNSHPTVKPVDLIRYLARLTATPTGGIVLDPFFGSGTLGVACNIEGRPWIGIELDPDHCAIARARTAQQGLFTG